MGGKRKFAAACTEVCCADKTDLGLFLFAGAASLCTCGGLLAAVQPMSRQRTLLIGSERLIQGVFFAAWRLDTKTAGPLHGVLFDVIRKPNVFAHIHFPLVPKLPSKPYTNLEAPHCSKSRRMLAAEKLWRDMIAQLNPDC